MSGISWRDTVKGGHRDEKAAFERLIEGVDFSGLPEAAASSEPSPEGVAEYAAKLDGLVERLRAGESVGVEAAMAALGLDSDEAELTPELVKAMSDRLLTEADDICKQDAYFAFKMDGALARRFLSRILDELTEGRVPARMPCGTPFVPFIGQCMSAPDEVTVKALFDCAHIALVLMTEWAAALAAGAIPADTMPPVRRVG